MFRQFLKNLGWTLLGLIALLAGVVVMNLLALIHPLAVLFGIAVIAAGVFTLLEFDL